MCRVDLPVAVGRIRRRTLGVICFLCGACAASTLLVADESREQGPLMALEEAAVPLFAAELEHIYKNYGTIHFTCEDFGYSDAKTRDDAKEFTRWNVFLDVNGKRIMQAEAVKANSSRLFLDLWEDGRQSFRVQHPNQNNQITDTVYQRRQANTRESYDGPMNAVLWTLAPGGKPLYAWVKQGARVEKFRSNEQFLYVSTTHKGSPLRCKLDRDHDWLPSEIHLGEAMEITVSDFSKNADRWYPKGGVLRSPAAGTVQGFTVTTFAFRVNDDGHLKFTPIRSELNAGAVVVNSETREARIIGGVVEGGKAREDLLAKYGRPLSSSDDDDLSKTSLLDRTGVYILLGSLTLAVVWAFRRLRGSQKASKSN